VAADVAVVTAVEGSAVAAEAVAIAAAATKPAHHRVMTADAADAGADMVVVVVAAEAAVVASCSRSVA
jgi:hypothetical protein